MKLAELFEMAKSANKRKREAKRARKDKAEKPSEDKMTNPVAKFAQTTGAGAHKTDKRSSKNSRKEGKRQAQDY